MFDGVPWAVENGAKVEAAVARAAHYAATQGAQGVSLPGDLKVTATPAASQTVRLAAGSATLLNQQAPGESYQGLARSFTDVDINVTGAARYDLVVGRVVDPDFPPWQPADVPDPVNGPYFQPHVIEGVSSGTTKAADVVSYSAVELARIAVPASGNITNGMITDLRQLAQPRTRTRQYGGPPDLGGAVLFPAGTSEPGDPYNMAPLPGVQPSIEIPDWATHMDVVATATLQALDGSSGAILVKVGSLYGPHINWSGGVELNQLTATDIGRAVPANLRGTTQTATLRVRVDAGQLALIGWSSIVFSVSFYERVV